MDVQIIAATNQNLIEKVNSGDLEPIYTTDQVFLFRYRPFAGRKKDIVALVNIYYLNQ